MNIEELAKQAGINAWDVRRNKQGELSIGLDGVSLLPALETFMQLVVTAERKSALNAINAMIKYGDLGGNGCDKNAQRNGIILASNLLTERMFANAKL